MSSPALYHPAWIIQFQIDMIAKAYLLRQCMVVADMGTGKALKLSEIVLTPDGWVRAGSLRAGDLVIGRDGRPTKVLGVFPQDDRKIYTVTMNDGSSADVTASHLWSVQTPSQRWKHPDRWVIRTTEEIARTIRDTSGNLRWRIPLTEPVLFNSEVPPDDPYTVGVILGDGHSRSRHTFEIDTDLEILNAIEARGIREVKSSKIRRGYVSLNSDELYRLRSWEKFIPEKYLRSVPYDRLALLQGLLDTDGSPMADGGVEYSTTSPMLRDGVIELVQSLGGIARLGKERVTEYTYEGDTRKGRLSYRVNVKLPAGTDPFRLSRKLDKWVRPDKYPPARLIKSVEYSHEEDSVCIKVAAEDGLFLTRHHIVTHNTHIGMGLAAAALMYQDADLVLIVCEKNKVLDFRDELAAHTSMSPVVIYHGPGRHKRLSAGEPMVVITSYETARQDLAVFASKRARKALDGPLLQMLLTRRPVIIYDEISAKLGNRSSAMYKAHAHMLARLRTRDPQLIVAGMTGTPIERDWENAFNALRLLTPSTMPQVGEFEKRYTYGRDDYNRLKFRSARMHEFAGICAPRMLRKRKTDPDVRDQFPAKTEEFVPCEMHADQQRLYTLVEDLGWDENGDERKVPGLLTVLRQLAGHPAAVLRSDGKLAQIIRESLGPALLECSSVKTELLLDLARRIADEDAKLLAFTFYGQSVLPVLVGELTRAGHALFVTHGGMSANEQHEERARFRAHQGGGVLLSSDAGARGVNVPEATCVAEYEAGLTHALRTQRFARAHRIGHDHGPLTCLTFVLDGTIEVPLMKRALSRNQQQDELLRDDSSEAMAEGYLTAADRRLMFSQARKRKS